MADFHILFFMLFNTDIGANSFTEMSGFFHEFTRICTDMHKDGYNVYCHYFSVRVVFFASVKEAALTKDTLISNFSVHTAEDMFQQLSAHISANFKTIAVKDDSYHLIGVLNEILILPQGCKFRLQGYDLFLDTPSPFFIKFGCGQLWIGARTTPKIG